MSSGDTNHNGFSNIKLGVVCPMANESASAVRFVRDVLDQCTHAGFQSVKFFAVLDKVSEDNTLELLQEFSADNPMLQVVWAPENRSVVDAYLRGYREAIANDCDWIMEIDAGYSHQPSDIPQFFSMMKEGYDCVFGSRFCSGGRMEEAPAKRYIVSRGGTILTNLLLGTRLADMTSGFELFSRGALESVMARGVKSRGPFFQTEIKTYCRNLFVAEVPIHYRAPSHNLSNSTLNDALTNLWRLFKLRITRQL